MGLYRVIGSVAGGVCGGPGVRESERERSACCRQAATWRLLELNEKVGFRDSGLGWLP